MNVVFYCGNYYFVVIGVLFFIGFNKWFKVGYCLFYYMGGFYYLWQEYFVFVEQIVDYVYVVYQWFFNDFNWVGGLLMCFFGVLFDKFGNVFYQ